MSELADQPIRHAGTICDFDYEGKSFSFFVSNKNDSVQGHHYAGRFYETEDLQFIRQHVSPGAKILDIGANVGNHTVYFANVLNASRVYPFEPNPVARQILNYNVALNRSANVEMKYSHFGLGSAPMSGMIETRFENNLGLGVFRESADGECTIIAGDSIISDCDFIKIDVEGYEMHALRGLEKCIAASSPKIFIEVDIRNQEDFDNWVRDNGYAVDGRIKRYEHNENFFISKRQ